MGTTPKALLPWRDSTLLDHALTQARLADVSDIVVVLGPSTAHLQLDCKTAYNAAPQSGRSASIRLGAAALSEEVEAILIQSVDQPTSRAVLEALFAANAEVAVPTHGGRRGHPVCVSGALLQELREVTEEDQGLRAMVRRHSVTQVAVDDESVLWNLNDPAAYAAAMGQR
jgi:molybdenum cofactor cytidylyltransferase